MTDNRGKGPDDDDWGPPSEWQPPGPSGEPEHDGHGDRRRRARWLTAGIAGLVVIGAAVGIPLALNGSGSSQPPPPPPSPTTTSPTTPASTSPVATADPAQVITKYFTAINNRDYQTAWNLYAPSAQAGETYTSFADGFKDTEHVAFAILDVSGNNVSVYFASTPTGGGSARPYQGVYVVQGGLITSSSIASASPS